MAADQSLACQLGGALIAPPGITRAAGSYVAARLTHRNAVAATKSPRPASASLLDDLPMNWRNDSSRALRDHARRRDSRHASEASRQLPRACRWNGRNNGRDALRASNENKMSDGGRERASLGVEVWKSSQNVNAQRSAVRSIAWLDAGCMETRCECTLDEPCLDLHGKRRQLACRGKPLVSQTAVPRCESPPKMEVAAGCDDRLNVRRAKQARARRQ